MSDDLVQRLRREELNSSSTHPDGLLNAAADALAAMRARIAALEEALTLFTAFYSGGITLELDDAFRKARAALENGE